MKSKIAGLLGALALFACGSAAQAQIVKEGTVLLTTNKDFKGQPGYAHLLTDFDSLSKGSLPSGSKYHPGIAISDGGKGYTATLTGQNASIVNKTTSNYVQPWSNSGKDTTNYLEIGANGSATFTLSGAAHYVGFLWGSVDKYNSVSFYDKLGHLISTFTGADMPRSDGNQGLAGSFYANFTSSVSIYKIVFTSCYNAFEVDNISISAVPVPAALPLFGAALAGLGAVGRRRRKAMTAA